MATKATQLEQGRAIFEAIAKSAHYSEAAWRELDAVLPQVRDKFPAFYENMLHLLVMTVQQHQTMESAGDDLRYVAIGETPPRVFLPAVSIDR